MSAATHPNLCSLYGVRVPLVHFEQIKRIADVLVGNTDTREYVKDARRRCVLIACRAWAQSRTPRRKVRSVPGVEA